MSARRTVTIILCALLVIASLVTMLSQPQGIAEARTGSSTSGGTSGGGMGPGTGISHSGPAGRSTESFGAGSTSFGPAGNAGGAGSQTFGPATGATPGFFGGMTGGGETFGPATSESFQGSQYGAPASVQYGYYEPYPSTGASSYQQTAYGGTAPGAYQQSQVAALSSGSAMSLQSRGISQGTCMWDCTASYTPTECRQRCQ